jgi:hypothetical protein
MATRLSLFPYNLWQIQKNGGFHKITERKRKNIILNRLILVI